MYGLGLVPYLALLTSWRGESRKSKIEYFNFMSISVLASANSRGLNHKVCHNRRAYGGHSVCLVSVVASHIAQHRAHLPSDRDREASCVRAG